MALDGTVISGGSQPGTGPLSHGIENVKRILGLGPALVYTECDLQRLPPLGDVAPLYVREMDMEDDGEVSLWLEVHNDAFGRHWGRPEYARFVSGHEHLEVIESYFLMEQGRAVGAASLAVFRRKSDIGVCHYLGLRKEAQGRGFGRFLTLYRYHRAKERGLVGCESETTLRHEGSIKIHLDCGASIKPRPDPWNSPGRASRPRQWLADRRLRRLHERWQSEDSAEQPRGGAALDSILRDTFCLAADAEILDDHGPGSLPGWDSLGSVRLIAALEAAYGIELGGDEVLAIRTVKDLKELLRARGIRSE